MDSSVTHLLNRFNNQKAYFSKVEKKQELVKKTEKQTTEEKNKEKEKLTQ